MGREEKLRMQPEGRPGDSIAKFAAFSSALVLLVGSSVIIYTNDSKSIGSFAYHPPLQALAIILFTYGILTLQPTSRPSTKAAGLDRHQLAILFLGLPVFFLGIFSVIYKKWPYPEVYVLSWHGTFGYISLLWILLQIIGGGGSVWFGGAAFGGGAKAKAIWKYHRLSGYVVFPLLLWTAHLGGAYSKWVVAHSSYATRLAVYTVAPVVLVASVYARVRSSKMQF